jgi:hypothetical protein
MANPALKKLLKSAVVAGALALFVYHIAMVSTTLRLGEPMGYPEIVYRGIAEIWPHQYQPGHFVDTQDNYGPGYSTFCRPFLALFPDPYEAARVANLAALLGATGILLGILRANRVSWVTAIGVTSIFFALNAGSSSIQARPDFLATLLIMAVLALGRPAFLRHLGTLGAGVALGLLGLAAFLTKPYCLLAWGAAASFPFIAGKSGLSTACSTAVAGISAAVIGLGTWAFASANPYFLTETVLFHFAHSDLGLDVFLLQVRDFCILGFGLVGAVAANLVLEPGNSVAVAPPQESERRYWNWALALGVVAMALGLGWHRGAYLTYYYHLILPALAVVAAFAFEALPLAFTGIALIANCALLMALAPAFPRPDKDWDALARDVSAQKGPIVVDYMLEPLVQGRPDARVAGNGVNRFAIDLPDLIGGNSAVIRSARREVADFVASERALIRKGPDPEAIYMDCYLFPARPGDPRVQPGGYLAEPRNDHPLMLNGYDMRRYVPVGLFVIHPFYGSQNSPRQDAGKWILTIVKFARIEGILAGSPRGHLPVVLVPPAN